MAGAARAGSAYGPRGIEILLLPQWQMFCEFILEEIVSFVYTSGREASQELLAALRLNNLPVPLLLLAFSLELSSTDKRNVQQMRKLSQFLIGDFEGALSSGDGLQHSSWCVRELLPVIREYGPQLRDFGALLGVRLSEKAVSRGLNWASLRLMRN